MSVSRGAMVAWYALAPRHCAGRAGGPGTYCYCAFGGARLPQARMVCMLAADAFTMT